MFLFQRICETEEDNSIFLLFCCRQMTALIINPDLLAMMACPYRDPHLILRLIVSQNKSINYSIVIQTQLRNGNYLTTSQRTLSDTIFTACFRLKL